MRKLKIMEHISLDAVIQVSDGPGATATSHTATGPRRIAHLRGSRWSPQCTAKPSICCLAAEPTICGRVSGRRRRRVPWRTALNAATKYVATHRPESLVWGPFEGVGPDLVDSVRRIKAKDAADLILLPW